MATSNGKPARMPLYHVVRVDGDTLTIVMRGVRAKNQEAATDAYVDSLPAEQRNGEFGALLASSLKSWPYTARTVVVTSKLSRSAAPASDTISVP